MNRLGVFVLLFLSLGSVSCSTYRSHTAHYRGPGGGGSYKVASDYSAEGGGRAPAADGLSIRSMPYRPSGPFQMVWPVQRIKLNRGFKPPSDPKHAGIDLGGKRGTPILSAHEGVVIYTGDEFRGYGNMIIVEYGDEWATLYGHLDKISVETGAIVGPGDAIGTMGDTGVASGVHLHFELLHNRQPVDPLNFLTRGPRYAKK